MSATTVFNRCVVRDAGELAENKAYSSYRSLSRFQPTTQTKSKHEDIFQNNEFEMALSAIAAIPPQHPPASTESRKEKKTRHPRTRPKESHSTAAEDEQPKTKGHHKSERPKEEVAKEEDFMSYLDKRHERRRKKLAENTKTNEDAGGEQPSQPKRSDSRAGGERKRSASRSSKTNTSKQDKDKEEKKQFMLKPDAFSENANVKEDSESDSDDVKVDIQKSNQIKLEKINFSSEYFGPIKHGATIDFLLTPAPPGKVINCKIRKGKGILSDMQFYLEDNVGFNSLHLLMKTQRRMTTAKIYHFINAVNYDEFWEKSPHEPTCARIVSNMSRKKFKIDLQCSDLLLLNKDILNVEYKTKVGEPRSILADASLCSASNNAKDKVTYFLKNRAPHFDVQLRKFVLNYNGRAKLSSKHNFQIVDKLNPEEILMQLGKIGNGFYNCDFSFPFCALQAFGFALSSLCR